MPTLDGYNHFAGRHWETGSVHNALAYQRVRAPHTGEPYSEAFLLGVSGGAVMGYFPFAYEGWDPMARILTRNTFSPLDRFLERLGVVQTRLQTAKADRAVDNLVRVLEEGTPAIVWADTVTLPYNASGPDAGYWAMFPLVVYGYEPDDDQVCIADRAMVPLTVTVDELAAARARVKKDKHRLLTVEPPDTGKLVAAARAGIDDTIKLYTEAPPKGARHNFGLAAFARWAEVLVKPKMKGSWAKVFPPGQAMLAGLTSAFGDIMTFGKGTPADRAMYADFLDEAAVLLERPALRQAAEAFRSCGEGWERVTAALLPDDIAPLAETAKLILRRHRLFLEQGGAARDEMRAIDGRLDAIKVEVAADFPLDAAGVVAFRERLADTIRAQRELEATAVDALNAALN